MNKEKLARMASAVRTGGPGSMRRKKKTVHKNVTVDEKKLKASLKRLGVNDIPAIEEVNLFKDDGTVIHFVNPKGNFFIITSSFVIFFFGYFYIIFTLFSLFLFVCYCSSSFNCS